MIVYHIDKENRKIYAAFSYYKPLIELTKEDHITIWTTNLADILYKRFRLKYLDIDDEFIEKVVSKRSNFIGIAKCHPDDEFDIAKGKALAKLRLLEKYYKVLEFLVKKLKVSIFEIPSVINIVNSNKSYKSTLDKIQKLLFQEMAQQAIIERYKIEE